MKKYLLISFVLASLGAHADWVQFDTVQQDPPFTVYIDMATVSRATNVQIAKAWVLSDFQAARMTAKSQPYLSTALLNLIDCTSGLSRPLGYKRYADHMAKGLVVDSKMEDLAESTSANALAAFLGESPKKTPPKLLELACRAPLPSTVTKSPAVAKSAPAAAFSRETDPLAFVVPDDVARQKAWRMAHPNGQTPADIERWSEDVAWSYNIVMGDGKYERASAMLTLSEGYLFGRSLPRDLVKAEYWAKKALDQNDYNRGVASRLLVNIRNAVAQDQKDREKAAENKRIREALEPQIKLAKAKVANGVEVDFVCTGQQFWPSNGKTFDMGDEGGVEAATVEFQTRLYKSSDHPQTGNGVYQRVCHESKRMAQSDRMWVDIERELLIFKITGTNLYSAIQISGRK